MPRTEKDLWVEMSIREIWTQAHFANLVFSGIDPRSTDSVFASIHAFLSHCGMISKLLRAEYEVHEYRFERVFYRLRLYFGGNKISPTNAISSVLGIPESSAVHQGRKIRNHLEHYDERLRGWITRYGPTANVGAYNIGPKTAISVSGFVYVSHYDPGHKVFTFVNKDFDIGEIHAEVLKIKSMADKWVNDMQGGVIAPPFI